MAIVAGTCYFQVDGVSYSLKGNLKIDLGDKEKEPVVGMDGIHGFIQRPAAPSIECDITDQPSLDPNILEGLDNVTVTVRLLSGKIGTLNNATQVNKLSVNGEDGKMTVKFVGLSGKWLPVAQTAAQRAS